MKRKRYTDEQIAYALQQVESGTSIAELCRTVGVIEQTFYNWLRSSKGWVCQRFESCGFSARRTGS